MTYSLISATFTGMIITHFENVLSSAASIGVADRKGSLEAGKDADIVLMDGDCNVLRTIVGGVTKFVR